MAKKLRARMPTGGGAMAAQVTITLTGNTVDEGADEDTLIGAITVTPEGAVISLHDSDGNKFALDEDNNIVAGSVPTDFVTDGFFQNITVRATYAGHVTDKQITINITPADITALGYAGAGSFDSGSPAGTYVGTISSTPPGAGFVLSDNDGNKFAMDGNDLVAGAVPTDHDVQATENLTILATRGGKTFSQDFAIGIDDV